MSDQSETHILLMHVIFEAHILLMYGIFCVYARNLFEAITRSKATARWRHMYAITSCKLSSYAYMWYFSISHYGEPKRAYALVPQGGP
jgi:hypothetical protein